MDVSGLTNYCREYFHPHFHKKMSATDAAIQGLKIASYFFIVPPLFVLLLWGGAALLGRITVDAPDRTTGTVSRVARQHLHPLASLKSIIGALVKEKNAVQDNPGRLTVLAKVKDAEEELKLFPSSPETKPLEKQLAQLRTTLNPTGNLETVAAAIVANCDFEIPKEISAADVDKMEALARDIYQSILSIDHYLYVEAIPAERAQYFRQMQEEWADQVNLLRGMIWSLQDFAPPLDVPAVLAEVRGIPNLGNSCYMNASLQALLSHPGCVQKIASFSGERPPEDPKEAGKYSVRKALVDFLKAYHDGKDIKPAAEKVREAVFTSGLSYEFIIKHKGKQQDAGLLVNVLLDALEMGYDNQTHARGKVSATERMKVLAVPLEKTLQEAVNTYFKPVVLPDSERKDREVKQVVPVPPDLLPVQIKRFAVNDQWQPYKLNTSVEVPDVLWLPGAPYQAAGLIVHRGDAGGGHYNAYVRRGGKYFCCDDDQTWEVSKREWDNAKERAYFVMFELTK